MWMLTERQTCANILNRTDQTVVNELFGQTLKKLKYIMFFKFSLCHAAYRAGKILS